MGAVPVFSPPVPPSSADSTDSGSTSSSSITIDDSLNKLNSTLIDLNKFLDKQSSQQIPSISGGSSQLSSSIVADSSNIDYSSQLVSIDNNLISLNQGITTLSTEFYFFLFVGSVILMYALFYRFLKFFV